MKKKSVQNFQVAVLQITDVFMYYFKKPTVVLTHIAQSFDKSILNFVGISLKQAPKKCRFYGDVL